MKSYTFANMSASASVILSSLSFITALMIVPLVRILPESIGLPIFMILTPVMVVCALTGMILGGLGLTRETKRPYLSGLLLGAAALVVHVVTITVS